MKKSLKKTLGQNQENYFIIVEYFEVWLGRLSRLYTGEVKEEAVPTRGYSRSTNNHLLPEFSNKPLREYPPVGTASSSSTIRTIISR